MSGLFNAVGRGLSAAGYAAGEMFAKGALMDQQSEIETQKALRLAEFQEAMAARGDRRKVELAEESAERSRTGQVARIDAKAGELADSAVGEKRGLIDAGIADRSLWTAEQQATVDQSLANDRKAMLDDPKTRTKAAVATGDIDPKTMATLDQKGEALTYKLAYEREREDGRDRRADARLSAQERMAHDRNEALLERMRNGEDVRVQAETRKQWTTLFSDAGRRLAETRKALTTLQKSPAYSMAEPGSSQARELDDLRADMKQHTEDRQKYGELLAGSQIGGRGPKAETRSAPQEVPPEPGVRGSYDLSDPALEAAINDIKDPQERANARSALTQQRTGSPKPSTETAGTNLPPGARQIGTAGGKPVYEINGKRYIAK